MLLLLFLNAVFFLKGKNFAPLTKTRAYCAFYGIGVFISSKSYSLYKFVRYVRAAKTVTVTAFPILRTQTSRRLVTSKDNENH